MRAGAVEYICKQGDYDKLQVFANRDEAIKYVEGNTLLRGVPYQIVELGGL